MRRLIAAVLVAAAASATASYLAVKSLIERICG